MKLNLSELNKQQRKAAETLDGPVLVLAGAGSGKTRALTYRVANLINHGVPAGSILALTFTNKAAEEMKNRIRDLVGAKAVESAWISTFHSSCARILRRDIEKIGYLRSFVIYDDDDQKSVLRQILKQLDIDDKWISVQEMRALIGEAKNALLSPEEWLKQAESDRRNNRIYDIMSAYDRQLHGMNALDFDDLLIKTLELFVGNPPVLDAYRRRFKYVLVDEYQDTNRAQYELIRMLTAESRNLCVVGDDDQSIYGWRGARLQNILDFEKDYPETVTIRLEQNYRSTSNILDAANQVIANNENRKDKKLWTEGGEGEKIKLFCANDEKDEAAWIVDMVRTLIRKGIKRREIAVLYRTNAQSRIPEEMLSNAGIPYMVYGGMKFYDRREIRDVIAYLRVIVNSADDTSLRRIINVPKRSIGDGTVQTLIDYANETDIPLYSALGDLPDSLGSRPKKCVAEFYQLMTMLSALKDTMPLADFIDMLIDKTGLEKQYLAENTDEARTRLENIQEFKGAVRDFAKKAEDATLESYLENIALVTDLDRRDESSDNVALMTLHNAKGLEFENVFIAGLEEGVFPTYRSSQIEERIEEERRLMYVGMTRAKKRLFLSHAASRTLYNQTSYNAPSRFISEIPDRLKSDEWTSRKEAAFGPIVKNRDRREQERSRKQSDPGAIGRPKLTFHGNSLDSIPGVTKGFVPSAARASANAAAGELFEAGDHVLHRKFGAGVVRKVNGTGKNTRYEIEFAAYGTREFEPDAPLVRLED